MLDIEEVISRLESGAITADEAVQELMGSKATDGKGLAIGTLVAIKRGDSAATIKFAGDRNVNWGVESYNSAGGKIQPCDIFRMCSVTKILTAEIIKQLVLQGKITLNDKAVTILPDILQPLDGADGRKIRIDADATVDDLLMHLSGITNYPDNPDFVTVANSNPGKKWTIEETVLYTPKGSKQRGNFAYSDTGYNLLGIIAQRITGVDFYNLAKLTAQKMGLKHTYFYPDIASCEEVFTQGYGTNPKTKLPISHLEIDTSFAGGGMFSSAEDMLILAKINGNRFADGTSDALFVPIRGDTPSRYIKGDNQGKYAYGIMRQEMVPGNPCYGHGGYGRGGRTKVFYFPKSDTSIVILQTWENITVNIAKEIEPGELHKLEKSEKDKAKAYVRNVTLTIRDLYSDSEGNFNRGQMLQDWQKSPHLFRMRIKERLPHEQQQIRSTL